MHVLLLAIAVILPCWYAYRRSVAHGLVEINHVTTLTFGFLFYWITPLAVRVLASKVDFPLAPLWATWFRASLITPYALSCIALYLCFALGDSLGAWWFRQTETRAVRTVPNLALALVAVFGCGLMVYSAHVVRANLFRPATPTDFQVGVARSAVTACVVLLGAVALMFTIGHPEMPWRKLVLSGYYLPALVGGGMMLALGSRLYVASLLVMLVIHQTNLRARFKLKTVIATGVLFAFFFGVIGEWREGSSATGASSNVFLEPMIGSVSLVHHLRYKGIAWINQPTQLISDFQNLVPTLLMLNKYKVLTKPEAYRPLGGLNSFVSFNLNFGLIGTAGSWLLWPILFRWWKSRLSDTLFATMYIMCSGWLAFTFFRDAFSISLVKLIFEDSIVIPLFIVGLGQLLVAACSPANDGGILVSHSQPEGA